MNVAMIQPRNGYNQYYFTLDSTFSRPSHKDRGQAEGKCSKPRPKFNRRTRRLTSDTAVVYFEVALEFFVAWPNTVERRLNDFHRAATSARAAPIEQVQHVGKATHEPEVGFDAAAEPHPAVQRRSHQDDLVVQAAGVERLVVTIFLRAAE